MLCSVVFNSAQSLASPANQHAVNMQDGGLILKEENDFTMNVERTYRSRSLELGYFGMGWCSDFESQLVFQGRGAIRLVNCQSSRPSLFKVSSTAASYINSENSEDQIVIKMGFYERRVQNEWVAKYNFKGKLIELRRNKNTYKLIYNARALPETIQMGKKLIQFEWHPVLNLVEKIKTGAEEQILSYTGFSLIRVKNGNKTVQYSYDDLDNLTERKKLDQSIQQKSLRKSGQDKSEQKKPEQMMTVTYDKTADKVLKIEGACVEKYSYEKETPKRAISTVSKFCQNQGSKTEFIFEYAKDSTKPSQIVVNRSALTKIEKLSLNLGSDL